MPKVTIPSLMTCSSSKGRMDSIVTMSRNNSGQSGKRIKATVATIPVATSVMTVSSPLAVSSSGGVSGQPKAQTLKPMPRLAPIQSAAPRSPYAKSHSVDSVSREAGFGNRQKRPLVVSHSQDTEQAASGMVKPPPSKIAKMDAAAEGQRSSNWPNAGNQRGDSQTGQSQQTRTAKGDDKGGSVSSTDSQPPPGHFVLSQVPASKNAKKAAAAAPAMAVTIGASNLLRGTSGTSVEEHGGSPGRPSGNGVGGETEDVGGGVAPSTGAAGEEKPQRSCKGKLYKKIFEQRGMKKQAKKDKKVS